MQYSKKPSVAIRSGLTKMKSGFREPLANSFNTFICSDAPMPPCMAKTANPSLVSFSACSSINAINGDTTRQMPPRACADTQ